MIAVDIKIFGDDALEQAMGKLEDTKQRAIVRTALRESGKRLWPHIIAAAGGRVLQERTGRLVAALQATRPKAAKTGRDSFGIQLPYPERSALGIGDATFTDADPGKARVQVTDKRGFVLTRIKNRRRRVKVGYYPAILEYGAPPRLRAKRWIRDTVNKRMATELAAIHAEITTAVQQAMTLPEPKE